MTGFRFARADGGHATVVGAGTDSPGATPIVSSSNFLTSETGETAFMLPEKWPAGTPITVVVGTVTARIFPYTGGSINNGAADAVFTVTNGKSAVFWPCADGDSITNWIGVMSA